MKKVSIITDSTSDLSKELLEQYDITVFPMSELDGMSIDKIAQKRERYAEKNSDIIENDEITDDDELVFELEDDGIIEEDD